MTKVAGTRVVVVRELRRNTAFWVDWKVEPIGLADELEVGYEKKNQGRFQKSWTKKNGLRLSGAWEYSTPALYRLLHCLESSNNPVKKTLQFIPFDQEFTKHPRGQVTYPRSHSWPMVWPGLTHVFSPQVHGHFLYILGPSSLEQTNQTCPQTMQIHCFPIQPLGPNSSTGSPHFYTPGVHETRPRRVTVPTLNNSFAS